MAAPHGPPAPPRSLRARWAALRNIAPFLRLVWRASPGLLLATLGLRLARAVLPVSALWLGKLIIDEVIRLSALPGAPEAMAGWWRSGLVQPLALLVLAEFALAIASDLLSRATGLVDALLSERLTMSLSLRLMDHAAALDLADFEDAEFQDKLDRARRQSSGRIPLLGQLLGQMQDLVTVASFAGGLVLYNPWLIALLLAALIPAFLGEAHFNAQSYSLDYRRTPERRELDYLRQTAASAETAKEVKIFGLGAFLTSRYRSLSQIFFAANRRIAQARAAWGVLFTGVGTVGYYLAYVWTHPAHPDRHAEQLAICTFRGGVPSGAVRSLVLEGSADQSFPSTAAQALYLEESVRLLSGAAGDHLAPRAGCDAASGAAGFRV